MNPNEMSPFLSAADALDKAIKWATRSAIILQDRDGEYVHYARIRYLSRPVTASFGHIEFRFFGGRVVFQSSPCDYRNFRQEAPSWQLANPSVRVFTSDIPQNPKSEAHYSVQRHEYPTLPRRQPARENIFGLRLSSSRSGRQIDTRQWEVELAQQNIPFINVDDLLGELGIDKAVLSSSSVPRIEIELENPIRFTDQTRFDGDALHVELSLPSELRDIHLFGMVKLDQRDGGPPKRQPGNLPKPITRSDGSASICWRFPALDSVQATIQVRYGTVILAETVVQHSLNSRNPLLEYHRALFPEAPIIDQLGKAGAKEGAPSSGDFEALVAVCLGLAGLKQLAYRQVLNLRDSVDIVAVSDTKDVYLVEVSLGPPAKSGKAKQFRDRIKGFKAQVAERKLSCREVIPIFVTNEIKPEDYADHNRETMGEFKIVWRDELDSFVVSLENGEVYDADALAKRFRVEEADGALPGR